MARSRALTDAHHAGPAPGGFDGRCGNFYLRSGIFSWPGLPAQPSFPFPFGYKTGTMLA